MRLALDPASLDRRLLVPLTALLAVLVSGWSCQAFFSFNSCQPSMVQPVIVSISPPSIPDDTEDTLLEVTGSNFAPHSQILWNGNALPTIFVNSGMLQTTINGQTFTNFGGTAGSTVQISVVTPPNSFAGCTSTFSSSTIFLQID